jgi:hypothetical protein
MMLKEVVIGDSSSSRLATVFSPSISSTFCDKLNPSDHRKSKEAAFSPG